MTMARRYHDNNPNKSVINLLLLIAAVLSLWNLWTAPSITDDITTSTQDSTLTLPASSETAVPYYLYLPDGSSVQKKSIRSLNGQDFILLHPRIPGVSSSFTNSVAATKQKASQITKDVEQSVEGSGMIGSSRRLTTTDKTKRNKKQKKRSQTTIFLILSSCSIIAGAVMAKAALDGVHSWEQQSKEDSLVYDMAYTESFSELGYGSFVSDWSSDLDKFDL